MLLLKFDFSYLDISEIRLVECFARGITICNASRIEMFFPKIYDTTALIVVIAAQVSTTTCIGHK